MPLMFDMPLQELKTYQGSNPKPPDFETFWDTRLEEMAAVDPRVELKSAEFQTSFAECFHLFFTGVGEARIHAKFLRPRISGTKPYPAVLMFHGYSANTGDWFSKLPYAAASTFSQETAILITGP